MRKATVAAGVLLAAVLLYFSLRGIEWDEFRRTVKSADVGLLTLAGVIAVTTIFLRGWRWRILLNAERAPSTPLGTGEGRVGVMSAFWATSAGLFGNNFLPARAGELVRTFMISAEHGLSKSYVLATAIAERIADAIVLVTIAAIVLLTLPSPPGWLAGAAKPFAVLGLAGAAAIAFLPLFGQALERLIARAPVPASLQARLIGATEQGLLGLRAFHDAGRLVAFVGIAIGIWVLDAAGTVIGAAALGLDLPFSVAFLLIAGLGLGSALPSTPGYIGIYQFVTISVLTPFGFTKAEALAYILVSQAVMYIVIGVLGAIGLLRRRKLA